MLAGSNLDFTGADFTAAELAGVLAADYHVDVSDPSELGIKTALSSAGLDLSGTDITPADIAAALDGVRSFRRRKASSNTSHSRLPDRAAATFAARNSASSTVVRMSCIIVASM